MGDIADMMLDGTLDEETGEYLCDHNRNKYGKESPGFPVSLNREAREKMERKKANIARSNAQKKTKCQYCGKKVKITGLSMHRRDAHGIS